MLNMIPVEDMAELFSPGIKAVMEENARLKHELEIAQARIEELHLIVNKVSQPPKEVFFKAVDNPYPLFSQEWINFVYGK